MKSIWLFTVLYNSRHTRVFVNMSLLAESPFKVKSWVDSSPMAGLTDAEQMLRK
jgi:hypothetical protein